MWVPQLGGHAARGTYTPLLGIGVGFGAAAVLAGATVWNKRLALGFAALVIGEFGPWGNAVELGFPFLALAIWLVLRYSRLARAVRLANGPPPRRPRGSPAPRTRPSRGKATASPYPSASKRYTPPRTKSARGARNR